MSSAISLRRQSASRKKSVRASSRAEKRPVERRLKTWVNEACAIFAGALSFFLLLSFLSGQASWSVNSSRVTDFLAGAMGPVGRFTGTLMGGFLGWAALVPVLWSAWLAVYFWNRSDDEPLVQIRSWWMLLLGIFGMIIFSAAAVTIIAGSHSGGSIGDSVSRPLVRLFSSFGAGLIVLVLLVASVALTTGNSVAYLCHSFLQHGITAAKMLFVQAPRFILKGGAVAWRVLWLPLSAICAVLFGSRAENEARPIPKPRVRKNALFRDSAKESDDDENEEPEVSVSEDEPAEAYDEIEPEDTLPPGPPAVVERKAAVRPVAELKKVIKQVRPSGDSDDVNAYLEYQPPDVALLTRGESTPGSEDDQELREKSKQIEAKLKDFGVFGRVTHIHPGPVITLFEFEPAPGVKVGRIAALQDDLAMSLRASSIRIIAPIPKRGTVGIEVPNRHRDIVRLRDLLESEAFVGAESLLSVPIGKDTYGDPVVADITTMPHLLMAGTTGTGKSVCINTLLVSLLYRANPADLGLILIDPKILELSVYEDIPHLRVPVVTAPKQARAVLEWATHEMERRYRMMQKFGVRNIDSYNRVARGEEERDDHEVRAAETKVAETSGEAVSSNDGESFETPSEGAAKGESSTENEPLKPLPKIVIVIDELADLMLSVGREIEELITRLAQKARAAGIHLIVATQRPSVDVITGLIKANFPARLSFRVSSRIDSRTILDSMGAEKLLGRGDMLFMLPGAEALRRVHGAFVSDSEVKRVVSAIKSKCKPHYDQRIMAICEKALEDDSKSSVEGGNVDEHDEMYDKAVELVMEKGQASTSMIQRAFRIGYNRAARIVEMMEREGIVGPMDGVKPREVRTPGLSNLENRPAVSERSKDDLF